MTGESVTGEPTAAYKVVAYEPGAANVIDRATGVRLGYVLRGFYHWSAFMADSQFVAGGCRYRGEAASALAVSDPESQP